MKKQLRWYAKALSMIAAAALTLGTIAPALAILTPPANPVPGGTLDPTTIPKYVTPLVIPPVMPKSTGSVAPAADYDIAVRQFKQQILPGGIWGSSFPNPLGGPAIGPLPATTIWSYGLSEDPLPDSSGIGGAAGVAPAQNSTFNYPALTVENTSNLATNVRWINDLKDPTTGNYLPHLFNVDQSLHWANPPTANCAMGEPNRTNCETMLPDPYTGPVPFVTHVHGAHVQPHSDGYPEAWWLPNASNIPAGYSLTGSGYTQANNLNAVPGSAYYGYENTQAATTLWYHDHAMGMTRLNVYAGPAGFWLIRGGVNGDSFVDDSSTATKTDGILPGPAPSSGGGDPNFDPAARATIREIPVAIQDRSFNADGSLFYPADRSFFDGFLGPYIGDMVSPSDIPGTWNPEAFFNTMVVNGTTWPKLETAQARYRLRLLNGCNSRTLNLSMFVVSSLGADGLPGTADDVLDPLQEVPFYQIGAEQGFLPKVVKVQTGMVATLPGNGTIPAGVATASPEQALLLGGAERADVIVDFSAMPNGTRIRMINTAPDGPFGGFPDVASDPLTSGQVMDFIVNDTLNQPSDANATLPQNLVLPAEAGLSGAVGQTRKLSLNEQVSDQVCVEIDINTGAILGTLFSRDPGDPNFLTDCANAVPTVLGNLTEPMGPRQAQLGVMTTDALGNVTGVSAKRWMDPITEIPLLNSTEVWEIYNTTMDAHPIHLHLVAFEVIDRQDFDPITLAPVAGTLTSARPNEAGYKDTVLAYPGQITRIKAKFDIAGLYVWHCHIVEHEDNEMMRPFVVTGPPSSVTLTTTPGSPQIVGSQVAFTAAAVGGSGTFQYRFLVQAPGASTYTETQPYSTNGVYNWDTTGLTPGGYNIQVQSRNKGSLAAKEVSKSVTFWVVNAAPPTAVTLTSLPASPQVAGSQIAFTATASGGAGPYEYRFLFQAPGMRNYKEARAYAADNVFNWDTTALAAGAYNIQVHARNIGSPQAWETSKSITFWVVNTTPPTAVSLTSIPASPQVAGSQIAFTAEASGGGGPYEYRFLVKAPDWLSFYTQAQAYSTNTSFNWNTTGLAAGAYTIQVQARNIGSPQTMEVNKYVTFYVVNAAPPTAVSLTSLPASPRVSGNQIAFTASASGGDGGPYEYRFLVKAPGLLSFQTEARAYATNTLFNWNTTGLAAGGYTIEVHARNIGSPQTWEARKSITFWVVNAAPPTAVSLTAFPTSPQVAGTQIDFTATASGGAGPYEYSFLVKAPGLLSFYEEARTYAANNVFNWDTTGLTAGTYTIQVHARNIGSPQDKEITRSLTVILQ